MPGTAARGCVPWVGASVLSGLGRQRLSLQETWPHTGPQVPQPQKGKQLHPPAHTHGGGSGQPEDPGPKLLHPWGAGRSPRTPIAPRVSRGLRTGTQGPSVLAPPTSPYWTPLEPARRLRSQLSPTLTVRSGARPLLGVVPYPGTLLVPQLWLVISLVCVFHHCSPGAP